MRRRTALLALLVGVATLVAVQGSAATSKRSAAEVTPDVKHIFVIMLENHSQSSVLGDPHAPYINELAATGAVAANYFGVTHPSEPNYVAAISGSNWWTNNDDPGNRFDHTNVVDQLEAKHLTWGAYMESMPEAGYTGDYWPSAADPLYASKHDPFVLFDDIRNEPSRLAEIKPYSDLATDLKSVSTTPNFVWISPNQCHDMHGGVYGTVGGGSPCGYGDDAALKTKADGFVESAVRMIEASPAWHGGSAAIFIVADENDYTGNAATGGWASAEGCCDSPVLPAGTVLGLDSQHNPEIWAGGTYGGGLVPAVIVTNKGKSGGYTSTVPYNHYSLLATVEQAFGLGYLGAASDRQQVTPMTEFLTK